MSTLPTIPAPNLADLEARARERLQTHIDVSAAGHLWQHRKASRAILARIDVAASAHRAAKYEAMVRLDPHAAAGRYASAIASFHAISRSLNDLAKAYAASADRMPRLVSFDSLADRRASPRGARP